MEKMNATRALFFKDHKTQNECHATSDDQYFFKWQDAVNHSNSLQDKKVDTITRAEYDEWMAAQGEEQEAEDANVLQVEVTQEILDENPELAEQGVKLGDMIGIPKDDTQTTPEEIKADVKTAVSKKTAKKATAKKKAVAKKK
jgi:hypothetical protein